MKHNQYYDDLEHDIVGSCPHDVFYVSPTSIDLDGLYIQASRAGIVMRTPDDFLISRDDSYRYNLIHCVLRGRGSVSVRGLTRSVEAGQLFVLAANEGHMYSSDPRDPMGLVWVEFSGGNSSQLVSHILDLGGSVYSGSVFSKIVELCTSELYQSKQQGPKISNVLYQMLMCICDHVEVENKPNSINQRILKYIDENIDRRLTLTEVAAEFSYHPAYFSSHFSKTMGVSFAKYVMNRRISHACYLLDTTDWSVERIAQELGFCDISHFIQRFKAHEGMTPIAYRSSNGISRKLMASRLQEEKPSSGGSDH